MRPRSRPPRLDALGNTAILALLVLLALAQAPAEARAQGLLGLGGDSEGVQLAITETPIERIQRELQEREDSLAERLERFNTEAAWALQRLQTRRAALRAQLEEYSALRAELNPVRESALRHLLAQLGRETQLVLTLIQQVEDARDAHLSAFFEATSTSRHLRISLDAESREMLTATAEASSARLAELRADGAVMEARRAELIETRDAAEEALALLRDRLDSERQTLRQLEGELATDLMVREQATEDAAMQVGHVRALAVQVAAQMERLENERLVRKLTSLSFLVARRLLVLRSWSIGVVGVGLASETREVQVTVARILGRDLIRDSRALALGAAAAGISRAVTTARARLGDGGAPAPAEDERIDSHRVARLRLSVQRLERQAELRLETLETIDLSLESLAMRQRVNAQLLESWESRRESAAAHEQGGTFSRDPSPFAADNFKAFRSHTEVLLRDPARALERARGAMEAAPARPAGSVEWLILAGVFGLVGLVARRLAPRLDRMETKSTAGLVLIRAIKWASLPLPLSIALIVAMGMNLVPLVLEPAAWWFVVVPPLLAALRPVFRILLPVEGSEAIPASAARFLRVVLRATVQVACLLRLVLDLMPVFGYPPAASEPVHGAFLVFVVGGVTLALLRKRELLAAARVGEQSAHTVVNVLRVSLRRLYPILFLGPVASLLVYLAGYRNLSALLVRRGLIVLAVLTLGPFLHGQLMALTRKLVGFPDGGGPFLLPEASSKVAYRTAGPVVTLLVAIIGLAVLAAGWGYDGDLLSSLSSSLTYPLVHVGEREISLLSVLIFASILVLTFFVIRAVLATLRERVYPLYDLTQGMRASIDTLVKYLMFLAGVVIGLQIVGIGLGFLALFAGVIGIGIGFGSQALAANFISGLILQFTRPIEVGDHIEVEGILGQVQRITSYSTVVRTYDNMSVIVPNSTLLGNSVVNWTEGDRKVRVGVDVGVAYGSDVAKVRTLLLQAAEAQRLVRKLPKPDVLFRNFGDSSLDFRLRVWIDNPQDLVRIQSELRDRIDALFRENGVEIPFPQRDLHLRTVDIARAKGFEIAP
jgi:small-conductance mechanosensitive channel